MAIQDDNTILNKGDLKAYHEAIAPLLGGTFMVRTNNSDYYSTDEKVVGVWTDGKPLYQKTIYVSSGFTNPTNLDNSLNTTDVSIISLEGSVKMGNQYVVFLNRANIQSLNFQMEVYSSDTGLLFYYGSSISGINWVSVTVKYTKTTDTAGSATTTPGAYDINFPNTWPENTEIYFGNGLYGYRKTGTTAADNLHAGIVLVSNVSKTACCYNKGGMVDMSGTNGTNWYDINGGWDNKGVQRQFNPLITNTNQTFKFYCQDNQDYTTQNIQYNIWFTYTK